MIIVMKADATKEDMETIMQHLHNFGLQLSLTVYKNQKVITFAADECLLDALQINLLSGVEKCLRNSENYELVSRGFQSYDSIIDVAGVKIGGGSLVMMAGPCAVESREQILTTAMIAKRSGAQFLRGGAYKPRTSPYSFQGLEEEGLTYLTEAKKQTGLKIITEVTDPMKVEKISQHADMLQIGARNMQNFALLKEVGKSHKPVLLKRGLSATIDEWLNAAEYIIKEGNFNVVLCERGIRTYETYTRNTLDLSAVVAAKYLSHLPVIVDPSHGTGKWRMVKPMALAAISAGADGLMVEIHPDPSQALSDGMQSLTPERYEDLMKCAHKLHGFVRKENFVSIR